MNLFRALRHLSTDDHGYLQQKDHPMVKPALRVSEKVLQVFEYFCLLLHFCFPLLHIFFQPVLLSFFVSGFALFSWFSLRGCCVICFAPLLRSFLAFLLSCFSLLMSRAFVIEDQGSQPLFYPPSIITMSPIKFSTGKVRKALLYLNTSISSGPDGIPSTVLKSCAP